MSDWYPGNNMQQLGATKIISTCYKCKMARVSRCKPISSQTRTIQSHEALKIGERRRVYCSDFDFSQSTSSTVPGLSSRVVGRLSGRWLPTASQPRFDSAAPRGGHGPHKAGGLLNLCSKSLGGGKRPPRSGALDCVLPHLAT